MNNEWFDDDDECPVCLGASGYVEVQADETWKWIPCACDGMSETRAQLDELAQMAKGSHRQHIGGGDA